MYSNSVQQSIFESRLFKTKQRLIYYMHFLRSQYQYKKTYYLLKLIIEIDQLCFLNNENICTSIYNILKNSTHSRTTSEQVAEYCVKCNTLK